MLTWSLYRTDELSPRVLLHTNTWRVASSHFSLHSLGMRVTRKAMFSRSENPCHKTAFDLVLFATPVWFIWVQSEPFQPLWLFYSYSLWPGYETIRVVWRLTSCVKMAVLSDSSISSTCSSVTCFPAAGEHSTSHVIQLTGNVSCPCMQC